MLSQKVRSLVTSQFLSERVTSHLNFFGDPLSHQIRKYTIEYGALARKSNLQETLGWPDPRILPMGVDGEEEDK